MGSQQAVKAALSFDADQSDTKAVSRFPPERVAVSDEQLQAAARLRVSLGPGSRLIAVSGLYEDDGSGVLTRKLGQALAALEQENVLILESERTTPQTAGLKDKQFGDRIPASGWRELAEVLGPANLFGLPLDTIVTPNGLMNPIGREALDVIAREFRYVLINCGAVRSNANGLLVASLCNGVVLAARAGVRKRHELAAFQDDMTRLRISLLGVVLTNGKASA